MKRIFFSLLMVLIGSTGLAQDEIIVLQHPDSVQVNPVDVLNSPYRETNMALSPDGQYLYFMSLRGEQEWSSTYMTYGGDSVYDGDIWLSEKVNGEWSEPQGLRYGINTAQGEDEPVITAEGTRLYYQSWHYLWDNTGGPYYHIELFGETDGVKKVGMGGGITEFFREIQATDGMTISPDETTFIVAAGPDYDGNMDLYYSRKTTYGWIYCRKMPISTAGDERSVFLAADGRSLYFASNGYGGFGGLDIFKIVLNEDGSYGEVINLGEPFNTSGDDYGFVITADGSEAYLIRDGDIYFSELEYADQRIKPTAAEEPPRD